MFGIHILRRRILPSLLVLALGVIALQGFRILELQRLLREVSTRGDLRPGTMVPEFQADDLHGVQGTVAYGRDPRPTVLYVFSPSCVWCARNSEAVNALSKQVSGKYRIIGISLSPEYLKAYLESHRLPFPVYTNIPDSVISAYHFGPTPETLVISPDGSVLQTWIGAYSQSTREAIEGFFSIRLPDFS